MRRAFCSHQESPSRPTKTIKASKATKKDLNQIFFGLVANKIGPKWLRPLGGVLATKPLPSSARANPKRQEAIPQPKGRLYPKFAFVQVKGHLLFLVYCSGILHQPCPVYDTIGHWERGLHHDDQQAEALATLNEEP